MRSLATAALVLLLAAPAQAQQLDEQEGKTEGALGDTLAQIDEKFGDWVVKPFDTVLFFDIAFWDDADHRVQARCEASGIPPERCRAIVAKPKDERVRFCARGEPNEERCYDVLTGVDLPFIVLWLVLGAVFFTFRFFFINLRAFKHALVVTVGMYDSPDDPGEVSHFQALSSALSATVGLGNIAGVAVAVGLGGPGAVFWMIVGGFLGMTSKFTECTLGQLYRKVDEHGHVLGGPMRYLERGIAEMGGSGAKGFGKVLAVVFSIMCIGASFGGGNMFQANQAYAQISKVVPAMEGAGGALGFGVGLAALVAVVIIGGIRRIGTVASYIVPFMCLFYVLSGLFILVMNASEVPAAFGHIVKQAFTPEAGFGGLAGVLIQGFRRSAFSNEAGIGSAAIAHSAAATDEPVREGIVALLEPFIDTLIVCTMTALVIVVSGAYQQEGEGVVLTSNAFESALPWFPTMLSFAVVLFAFSTMISWSYYGERCWAYLLGPRASMIYRIIFLIFVVLGCVMQLGNVIAFSDLMILGMALPNVLGLVLLSNRVKSALDDYWSRYKAGSMTTKAERAKEGRP